MVNLVALDVLPSNATTESTTTTTTTSSHFNLIWLDDINTGLYWTGMASIGLALLVWAYAVCTMKPPEGMNDTLLSKGRQYSVQPRRRKCSCVRRPPYFILLFFWAFAMFCDLVSSIFCLGKHRLCSYFYRQCIYLFIPVVLLGDERAGCNLLISITIHICTVHNY